MAAAHTQVMQKFGLDFDVGVKSLRNLQTQVAGSLAAAMKASFGPRNLKTLTEGLLKSTASMRDMQVKSLALVAKLQKKNIDKTEREKLQAEKSALARQIRNQSKILKGELARVKKVSETVQKAAAFGSMMEAGGGHFAKVGQEIGETAADAMQGNIGGVLSKLGLGIKKLGMGATEKSAMGSGAGAQALGGIGSVLTKLGPALIAIGAIAAGFAAVAKIILDADSKMKELNKTLLDGGVNASDVADNWMDVHDSVLKVSEGFARAMGANFKWGVTAKDHLEILGKFADAGITMKEIAQSTELGATAMDRYSRATQSALVYSKIFGVTSNEMAENIGTWMEELGMGIKDVEEGLSAVHLAAKDSGFSTKRFYGILQTATSGMSMYNVRLTETASLLGKLGKYLGAKKGGEFLQTLSKGFSEMGMTDRIKMRMTMGEGRFRGHLGSGAEAVAGGFLEKKGAGELLATAGITGPISGAKDLVAALAKLDPVKQAAALAKAESSGNADLVRQLSAVMEVARGAKGGLGAGMIGMGRVDMATKLVMTLDKLKALPGVGGKPIYTIESGPQLVALENLSGMSGEQLVEYRELSKRFEGGLEGLRQEAKLGNEDAEVAAERAKNQGVVFKDGKVLNAKTLAEIKNVGDLIRANEEILREEAHDKLPQDIKLAEEIAGSTREMAHILSTGVEWLLSQINAGVEAIVQWLPWTDDKKKQKEAYAQNMVSQNEVLKEGKRKTNILGVEISKLKAEKGTLGQEEGDQRSKIDARIKEAEIELDRVQGVMQRATEAKGALMAGRDASTLNLQSVEAVSPKSTLKWDSAKLDQIKDFLKQSDQDKDKEEKDQDRRLKTEADKREVKQAPVAIAKEYEKVLKKQKETEKAEELLRSMGFEGPLSDVAVTQATEWLRANQDKLKGSGGVEGLLPGKGLPIAHDFILRGGRQGMVGGRIDEADVVTGAKPGGALSRAVGGGGVTNVYHMYNDGPGVMAAIKRAQSAGVIR